MCQKIEPVTNEQMEALKDFILKSKDGSDSGKKVTLWALKKTRNLSRIIGICFPLESFIAKEAMKTVHSMNSADGTTHLDLFLKGMGSRMSLGHNEGSRGSMIWITPEGVPPDPLSELIIKACTFIKESLHDTTEGVVCEINISPGVDY